MLSWNFVRITHRFTWGTKDRAYSRYSNQESASRETFRIEFDILYVTRMWFNNHILMRYRLKAENRNDYSRDIYLVFKISIKKRR